MALTEVALLLTARSLIASKRLVVHQSRMNKERNIKRDWGELQKASEYKMSVRKRENEKERRVAGKVDEIANGFKVDATYCFKVKASYCFPNPPSCFFF